MPVTPQITLTATLEALTGGAAGTVANPAKLVIELANYGLTLPQIAGTGTIAKKSQTVLSAGAGQVTVMLWGNDVITPVGQTYYAITVFDGEGNVVQTGCYQFNGTLTIDLSEAPQIYPAPPPPIPPVTGGITQLTGDVTAGPGNGVQLATVRKIQSRPVATTAPVNSAVLVWDDTIYDVRQLTMDDILPGFAITGFTGGFVVEIGATVTNPTFASSYSSAPLSAQITNDYPVDTPLVLASPFTSGTVTGSLVKNSQATVTFTLTAVSGTTKTATQQGNWSPLVFGGVGAAGATGSVTAGVNTAVLSTGAVLASLELSNNQVGQTFGPFTPSAQKVYLLLIGSGHTFKDPATNTTFAFNAGTAVSFVNQNGQTVAMVLYESTNTLTGSFSVQVVS